MDYLVSKGLVVHRYMKCLAHFGQNVVLCTVLLIIPCVCRVHLVIKVPQAHQVKLEKTYAKM